MARKDDQPGGVWYPRWFWPSFAAPATIWLLLFFVLPFYVVLSVAFGRLDPIFLTAEPVYNPVRWDTTPFRGVVTRLFTAGSIEQETLVRTLVYVGIATAACLLIGYPVAYFVARHAKRTKTWLLVAFIAPFWISYMMRMFAWVNLLQEDGYVNRFLQAIGVIDHPEQWLSGQGLHRGVRADLRLHPVHDPAVVRHARSHGPLDDRSGARPGRRPGQDVLPRHVAAVETGHPGRLHHRGVAHVR